MLSIGLCCSPQGQFLWENLIDLDREYHFEAELDVPIDRKNQMTSIRDEVRAMSTKDSSPTAASPPCACVRTTVHTTLLHGLESDHIMGWGHTALP